MLWTVFLYVSQKRFHREHTEEWGKSMDVIYWIRKGWKWKDLPDCHTRAHNHQSQNRRQSQIVMPCAKEEWRVGGRGNTEKEWESGGSVFVVTIVAMETFYCGRLEKERRESWHSLELTKWSRELIAETGERNPNLSTKSYTSKLIHQGEILH